MMRMKGKTILPCPLPLLPKHLHLLNFKVFPKHVPRQNGAAK